MSKSFVFIYLPTFLLSKKYFSRTSIVHVIVFLEENAYFGRLFRLEISNFVASGANNPAKVVHYVKFGPVWYPSSVCTPIKGVEYDYC